ncbi:MAG: SAM-dependent methyltransferase [Clostridia bacterium]|nr:SAM-dependent methyltransferase [Clostridia bacterium]
MKSFNRIRRLNQLVGEIIDEYKLDNVVVADIATDHGYLAELLSRNDKISKVIATDISQACLDKTNELKQRCGLDKIETRLGDGLKPIDTVDFAVLAGIGGYEIIKILDKQNSFQTGKNKCELFVLQPSKNAAELRLFLIEKNYKIVRDFIVFSSGKFYPMIVVDLNEINDTEKSIFNIYFGKDNNLKNSDFLRFLDRQIRDLEFIEKLSKLDIENSNDLKTKFEIFELAKKLIKKSKGD